MAKLPNYNLIYLTTYKGIFNTIINDDELKKECVKSSMVDEIESINDDKTKLLKYEIVNLGRFDFVIVCDNEIKSFVQNIMSKYGLHEINYIGIGKDKIKNVIDSEELNLIFYSFNNKSTKTKTKTKLLFDKKHLLDLDSLLTDYSYVNDCKYKIIAHYDYSLM